MSEMKNFLPNVDAEKVARMNDIRARYERDELSFEEARAEVVSRVGAVSAQEYALMEQTYVPTDDAEQCRTESLADMTALFGDDLAARRPSLPEGHPIDTYYRECAAVRSVAARMTVLLEKAFVKNPWLEAMDDLAQIKVHYARKQNQLYSMLERKGFMHPSKAMWTYDDYNRDAINHARALLDDDRTEQFLAYVPTMLHGILDLLDKEEAILFPTSLSMISEEEFRAMCEGDDEIGYCLIPAPTGFRRAKTPSATPADGATLGEELQALLAKHGLAAPASDGVLDVAQGKLTLEQINLIFRHMPVDLSFVDEHELVKFYTDTEHRVFPRSAGVIGRQVKNCHPPKSVHVVEEIIEKFRSGAQSEAEFWINKPEVFIYIKYIAVRDKEGRFRGVLEMMQDCTHIRALQGSQTLLHWADAEGVPTTAPTSPAGAAVSSGTVSTDGADATAERVAAATDGATPSAEKAATPTSEVTTSAESVSSSAATPAPQAPMPMPHACGCGGRKPDGTQLFQPETLRPEKTDEEGEVVTPQSKIFDLVGRYPQLKEQLRQFHSGFSMLSHPIMARIVKAAQPTVQTAAERVGISVDELVKKIQQLISKK